MSKTRIVFILSSLLCIGIAGCNSEPTSTLPVTDEPPGATSSHSNTDHGYVEVDTNNFKEVVINSEQPVLVDFFATWCPPCKIISPAIEEIATEYGGRAVVAKLNTDEASTIAGQYGINSIPTLIVFKDGREVDRIVGGCAADELPQFKQKVARMLEAAI